MTEKINISFDIEAKFKFAKADLTLEQDIDEININISSADLVPKAIMKFVIPEKYGSMLSMPYILTLKVKEKNMGDDIRTNIENEWLPITHASPNIRREENFKNRAEMLQVQHAYVLKDPYTAMNSMVGGVFENIKLEDVIKKLWNKTEHGGHKLNVGKLDNQEVYEQIWIPNMKFHEMLKYLKKKFGLVETKLLMFSDLKETHIKSINDVKDKPIKLIVRGMGEKDNYNVDDLNYMITNIPEMSSDINKLSSVLQKKIKGIKRRKDKLFEKVDLDVVSHLKKISFIDNSQMFDDFLEKHIKPMSLVGNIEEQELVYKEDIANILINNIKPVRTVIQEPIRLNHWIIGRKIISSVKIETKSSEDITLYLDTFTFIFTRNDKKLITARVNVLARSASLKNIYVGG